MRLTLSDRGSLIVPVAREQFPLPEVIVLGELRLVRKAEHHLTVLGYTVGKRIKAALKATPALGAELQAAIDATDFSFTATGQYVRLRRGELTTVVALVDAPGIAQFFAAAPAALELGAAPPPHVTLFTSDPEGKQGIGLNTVAELDEALAGGTALHAERLPAALLQPLG